MLTQHMQQQRLDAPVNLQGLLKDPKQYTSLKVPSSFVPTLSNVSLEHAHTISATAVAGSTTADWCPGQLVFLQQAHPP